MFLELVLSGGSYVWIYVWHEFVVSEVRIIQSSNYTNFGIISVKTVKLHVHIMYFDDMYKKCAYTWFSMFQLFLVSTSSH